MLIHLRLLRPRWRATRVLSSPRSRHRERLRQTARAFPVADVASALASGAACLSVGDAGEAEAAKARSRQGGVGASIRFAPPKEGGGLAIEAYAIPRDAPHSEQAQALLDFLLRPEISVATPMWRGWSTLKPPIRTTR